MSSKSARLGSWILAAAVILAGCEAPPPVSHDLADADVAAIRAAWEELNAVGNDWDAVEGFLTDDFVHLDPRSGPLEGVGPWREWVESMGFGDDESLFTAVEVAGSGDLGYVRWTVAGSWTEHGELMESSGKGISIYQRMSDGSWKLARNAWNVTP